MPQSPRSPRVSRRRFLAVAPTALMAEAAVAAPRPLPELARAWIEARGLARGLLLRWQDLEKEVLQRTGSLDFRAAARAQDGAALEMIAIDARLPALFEAEAAAAAVIAARPCRSAADALAKLEVGMSILGAEDTDATAWALLRAGYDHLAGVLTDEGGATPGKPSGRS